ncbi:prolyl oligopeptidase family serine peptidase [Brachybacterium halotolerans subsp. kimchii]|uniref:prolyl oligopeptidase family serine peptidase n=1 Tax=Brachybacterium halotolerans TaxID=2795215 RepID=UPI001E51C7F7|nr:prolyl oligopeptidase family serine peptidase [Brachybacterium halotolerans]UEJ82173.1 prolyl oligopeptidase family serine peptidase [Brachybacterium halotolerans subsp. kimchii]
MTASLPSPETGEDPWLWLEDVTGEEALAHVRERNARAEAEIDAIADPRSGGAAEAVDAAADGSLSEHLRSDILTILDASDRIPMVVKRGEFLYNVWTDAEHERGLWRRTTLESYRTDDPSWDVLLDVDALGRDEGENWVWHGAQLLRPAEGEPYRRALVSLSRGGSDADVTREFDLEERRFVPESEGGFVRPEAKGDVHWIDADTVWVTTDFGEGTLTTSGYARQARIWSRGTALADAQLVFEADERDMSVFASHDQTPGWERDWIVQMHAFYDTTLRVVDRTGGADGADATDGADGADGSGPSLTVVPVPRDMEASAHRDLAILLPRSDWQVGEDTFAAGSLLVADADTLLASAPEGPSASDLHVLFEPTPSTSLADLTITRSTLVLTILEDVVHRLEVHHRAEDGAWVRSDLYPELTGAIDVRAVDADESDEIWVTVTDFLTPTTLLLGDLGEVPEGGEPSELETVKASPARFDARGLEVTQHFATSEDGTRVPYFQIGRTEAGGAEEAANGAPVGPAPTLLYGYGGFEISMTPAYLGTIGKAWLERGGTYVVANIRGGGEYGPAWHQSALKEHRHRAYEDFAAVARDLVERGVTDRDHLAVRGGSNGGLLTGNMLTRYPELFGAVIIQVPLLDMKRYSHLLAGASWMAEYGDPDTSDWEFIRTFSPYHLLVEGTEYPPVFLLTSTRDDRVHPGHARKMTAALESLGADVRSWENIEGGHGGAATNEQAARMNALMYAFLWARIGADGGRAGADGGAGA